MKLLILIFKLIIFILYLIQLIPYFLIIYFINLISKILQKISLIKVIPEWNIKLNTHFIYYTSNILLNNHTNQFIIKTFILLQQIVLNLGINTGLILCRADKIHKGQGLLLKFQAYPQPLDIYNIYFASWFTLIQETKFLNNDSVQIFITTIHSSTYWDETEGKLLGLGDYKPGLCNLISDVKTFQAIKGSSWWTLHSNFTWTKETTIIDFIRAILPYHQTLVQARNVSKFQFPWINEVHVTSWKVSNELNKSLIQRAELKRLINREAFKHNQDNKNIMR